MKSFFLNIATKHFNVNRIMAMATKVVGGNRFLNNSIHRVKSLIGRAQNLIKNPPLAILKSLPTGAIGRLLSSRRIMAALPAGLGAIAGRFGGSGFGFGGEENGMGFGNGPKGDAVPSFGQGCMSDSGLGSLVDSGVDHLQSFLVEEAGELGSALGPGESQLFAEVTSQVTSFVSGRTGMVTALKTSVCKSEYHSTREIFFLRVFVASFLGIFSLSS